MRKDIDDDTQGYLSDHSHELQDQRRKLTIAMAALTDIATNQDKDHDLKRVARLALDSIKGEQK